ncbi:hypothetical protein CPB84DRAFT_1786001 [Gymnopilus junonius]|uniref:Uncharacterized protein n=1 Tax=Gymnopilus junonius TaxID=109634 RepID=A0A9P5TL98_GYMJU|nr:hypothetical protein CPB84DRAFT_1786001 [Gymnopilus junonius]
MEGESRSYKWYEYVPGDVRASKFRIIPETRHVGHEQGSDSVEAQNLTAFPLERTSFLRRYLDNIMPLDLKTTLRSASFFYNPETGDLSVTMCFPIDKSEDAWEPGHKIQVLSLLLGHTADARHYQVTLWIIQWARRYFNSTMRGIIFNCPQTCSSLTYTDIEHLYDPGSAENKLVPSSVIRFPRMHTLLWSGDAYLFQKFLAKVSSPNFRAITIQSRICIKDAHYILMCLSKTKAKNVKIESLSDAVLPAPAFVRDDHPSVNGTHAVLHKLETLKLGLNDIADVGALFDRLYLPTLRSLELVLADIPNPEEPLRYFTKTKKSKVFTKTLEVVNIVCGDSTLKRLQSPVHIGYEIRKRFRPTIIQFSDFEGDIKLRWK